MIERVGFIGLGDIGEPMARILCGAFEVVVHDLRAEAVQRLVDSGAKAAASAREVGERSDAVCVCVLDRQSGRPQTPESAALFQVGGVKHLEADAYLDLVPADLAIFHRAADFADLEPV
jgi:3-hydroxyisobutyrate dehydrogenase-like beta-hydroxyacid dehydrogenase